MPIIRRRCAAPVIGADPFTLPLDDDHDHDAGPASESGEHLVGEGFLRRETLKMWAPKNGGVEQRREPTLVLTPPTLPPRPSADDRRTRLTTKLHAVQTEPTRPSSSREIAHDDVDVAPTTQRSKDLAAGPRRYPRLQMEAVRVELPPLPPPSPSPSSSSSPSTEQPATSSGRMLDELDFLDADPTIALDLEAVPAGHVGHDTNASRMAGPRKASGASHKALVVHFTPPPFGSPVGGDTAAPLSTSGAFGAREMAAAAAAAAAVSSTQEAPPRSLSSSKLQATAAVVDPRRPGVFAFAGYGLAPENVWESASYVLRVLSRQRVLRRDLAIARQRNAHDIELYEAALESADADAMAKGLRIIAAIVVSALVAVIVASAVLL